MLVFFIHCIYSYNSNKLNQSYPWLSVASSGQQNFEVAVISKIDLRSRIFVVPSIFKHILMYQFLTRLHRCQNMNCAAGLTIASATCAFARNSKG